MTATINMPKGTSKKKATTQRIDITNQPPIGFSEEEPEEESDKEGLDCLFFCKG
jgi:hypothetical protein